MRQSHYFLYYILLVVAQILICNYLRLSPYLMLSLLPVLVLTLPLRIPTVGALCIAFATGLGVDLLAEGMLGINTVALLPVAFVRRTLARLLFGDELFARKEDFSIRRNGFAKVFAALLIAQALFLAVYIWVDGAGVRPFWFCAARFGVSLAAGIVVSLLVIDTLAPDEKK